MSERNIVDTAINNIFQDRSLQGNSQKWANWMSQLSLYTCLYCARQHGKIVDISMLENKIEVKVHEHCRCKYVRMRDKIAGTATDRGIDGADVYVMKYRQLPDYYVTKEYAKSVGWSSWKGSLADVLPEKMIGGDIYMNRDGKLPQTNGRIWYEADINYSGGFRNRQRILFSNDGLIFVSYDHFQTFYEITG